MSGNLGQPHASDPSANDADRIVREILDNRMSVTDISPSGELLRAVNRFNRNRANATQADEDPQPRTTTNPEPPRPPRISTETIRERLRRRRQLRHEMMASSPSSSHPQPPNGASSPGPGGRPSGAQSDSRRSRPRITESDRYLERHRAIAESRNSVDRGPSDMNLISLTELHQAGQQLESASSHLRALLDAPIANYSHSNIAAEEYAGEAEANRAFKRRRFDAGIPDQPFGGVAYGRFGQVEPGKLNMEIDSCDGGMFSEEHGANYAAANVLKNDKSVYCTKGNRCNLVLRHQGGTPFCLKELVIKAPPRGYTAPVQEGMVFVSMTSNDLLTRTAQYQIQYSPPRSSRRRDHQDNTFGRTPIISIRHNGDGTITAGHELLRPSRVYTDVADEDDYRPAQIPSDFMDLNTTPPFRVTTSCSDDDSETECHEDRRRQSHYIGNLRLEESDVSEQDSDPDRPWYDDYSLAPSSEPRRYPVQPRQSQPSEISIGLSSAIEAAQEATQEAVKAVGGNLMAPHARFFIERDKSKCTVRFEPPVSGRFILLKMWSPHHTPGGNIDIQSVVVKGFAGTRYFPSMQVR